MGSSEKTMEQYVWTSLSFLHAQAEQSSRIAGGNSFSKYAKCHEKLTCTP